MYTLMRDLLDLAQMKAQAMSITNDFFNLYDVINNACQVVAHGASAKDIKLITPRKVFHDSFDPFLNILGDERRYLQIIINFLSNAIKFSKNDSKIIIDL
jgi:signal transduction histidine kinase